MIEGLYECFAHWHKEGTVWIYSDPHFGDTDIPNRPTDEEKISLINSRVGRKDSLIVLGDIGDLNCAKKLKGYKILIAGNHDKGLTAYKKEITTKIFNKDAFTKNEVITEIRKEHPFSSFTIEESYGFLSPFERWIVRISNNLFDEVYAGPLIIGEKLILSHEPVNIPWAFNIHGHIHDKNHRNDKMHFNVCAEAINFIPINFNQWMRQGHLASIETIHRDTIDKAIVRKRKRERQ